MRGEPLGTCQRKPVVDLAMPVLRTGPDVAAARADREENHDPGGQRKQQVLTGELRLENRLPFASEGVLSEVADMYPAC